MYNALVQLVPILFPIFVAASAAAYQAIMQVLPKAQQEYLQSAQDRLARDITMANVVITAVVQSVEQKMQGSNGASKKEAAIHYADIILKDLKLPVSGEQLDAGIESAVYLLNQTQLASQAQAQPQVQQQPQPAVRPQPAVTVPAPRQPLDDLQATQLRPAIQLPPK